MAPPKSSAVLRPNLGLIYEFPIESVPPQGLVDGNNFRIKQGVIDTRLLGSSKFLLTPLPGVCAMIDNFLLSSGSAILIYATLTDLLQHNAGSPVYITPVYTTGTIAVDASGNVTGTGTAWNTSIGNSSTRLNVRPGDFIYIGSTTQNSPAAQWWKVATVTDNTHLTLASYTGGVVAAGTSYTARQCFGGTLDNPWATEYFPNATDSNKLPIGDQWVATNGLDPIVSWNGTARFCSYQSALGFTCNYLFRYKDQMLYLGITTNAGTAESTTMVNSDAGSPFNVSTGIANTETVTDGNFPIVVAERLYDNLVIYTKSTVENSGIGGEIILATFLGGSLGYAFRTVITGRGPLAMNLVADFGYYHKFLGYEGLWVFNGIGLQYTGGHVWRQVMQSVDYTRINRSFAYFDEQQGELIWAITFTTDTKGQGPEIAYVEHYLEDNVPAGHTVYSKRNFFLTTAAAYLASQTAITFAQLTAGWNTYSFRFNSNLLSSAAPLSLVADSNGNVLKLNSQDVNFDNSPIVSYVTFAPRILVDERHNGLIRRVYPFVQYADYNLTVTTTTYDRVAGFTPQNAINSYNMNQSGQRFVNPFITGRLGQLQFGTPGPSQPFVLEGYDWDIVPGGIA